jgi:hypothetical protein
MALQIRRGPTADRTGKVFAEGELVYDTQEKAIYIGDGTTSGGKAATTYTDTLAVDAVGTALVNGEGNVVFTKVSDTQIDATVTLDGTYNDVVQDTTPQLGGNLDLNSHTINGTGNINITGSVTATSFSGPLTGAVTGDVTGNVSGNAGTVTNGIYTNHSFYIGTEPIAITRTSGSQTLSGVSISGNAGTATVIQTARNINGVAFDGSTDITIADSTKLPLTGGTISSNLTITGNLTVNGTTTTVNSTTLDVADKNITIAKNATDNESADGAGITVAGANATLTYNGSSDKFVFNKRVDATSFYGTLNGALTGNVTGNINGVVTGTTGSSLVGTVSGDVTGSVKSAYNGTSVVLDTSTATATLTANVSGNVTGSLTATGSNRVLAGDGTAVNPSIAFDSDGGKDTGFYWGGDGYINVASNAVQTAQFGPGGAFTTPGTISGITLKADTISLNTLANNYIEFTNNVRFSDDVDFYGGNAFFNQIVAPFGLVVKTGPNPADKYVDLNADYSIFNQPVQFGRFTTAERNALTTAGKTPPGTIIFNTTDNQFQGFNNSAWVTLG